MVVSFISFFPSIYSSLGICSMVYREYCGLIIGGGILVDAREVKRMFTIQTVTDMKIWGWECYHNFPEFWVLPVASATYFSLLFLPFGFFLTSFLEYLNKNNSRIELIHWLDCFEVGPGFPQSRIPSGNRWILMCRPWLKINLPSYLAWSRDPWVGAGYNYMQHFMLIWFDYVFHACHLNTAPDANAKSTNSVTYMFR